MKKVKKIFWFIFLFILTLLVLVVILFAHRPARYAPVKVNDVNQVSPYLTNQLIPTIYNGTQIGRPFLVVITQQGLNDIIARFREPFIFENVTLTDPQFLLAPNRIILMATLKTKPLDLFATIELKPAINQNGLMILHVKYISLGLINITKAAISSGNKAYSSWLLSTGNDPNYIAAQICRSLLNDEPFEPIFEIGDKKVRVSKIDIQNEILTIQLTPIEE
jgi:uncharacterized protein YpmS